MNHLIPDQETTLEIGLVVLGGLLLGGGAVLVCGCASGATRRRSRHAERPSERGGVPAERHQHTGAVSSR